ncbi:hypothetical protein ACEU6E_01010 [Halorutilales archaeon Cl-col2-1]
MKTLRVILNANGVNTVDVDPRSLTVDGNFVIRIQNEGSPSHVYINTDDSLAPYVSIGNPNLYVEDSQEFEAVVDCDPETPDVRGELEITTGYGSETTYVPVSIEPEEDENTVDVDESLSQPQPEVEADDTEPRRQDKPEDGYRLRSLLAGIGVVILLVAAVVSYAVSALLDPVSGALVGVVAVVAGGIALYGVSLAYRKTDL